MLAARSSDKEIAAFCPQGRRAGGCDNLLVNHLVRGIKRSSNQKKDGREARALSLPPVSCLVRGFMRSNFQQE